MRPELDSASSSTTDCDLATSTAWNMYVSTTCPVCSWVLTDLQVMMLELPLNGMVTDEGEEGMDDDGKGEGKGGKGADKGGKGADKGGEGKDKGGTGKDKGRKGKARSAKQDQPHEAVAQDQPHGAEGQDHPYEAAGTFLKDHPTAKIIVIIDTHCLEESGAFIWTGDSPETYRGSSLRRVSGAR